VAAELFLDAPLFDFSQLLAYRKVAVVGLTCLIV
jgi:hypothetical protein